MYLILWQENENRLPGEEITLINPGDNTQRTKIGIGTAYLFYYKKSGKIYRKSYFIVNEIVRGCFQADYFNADYSVNNGHENLKLKFGKSGQHIEFGPEFCGDQFKAEVITAVYDIEGFNRFFWNEIDGYSETGVLKANIYETAKTVLLKCLSGKI